MTIKFFYNGIKVDGGKLERGHWSRQASRFEIRNGHRLLVHGDWITFYARDYGGLSRETCEAFTVENDSDSMTDYFETSRFTVTPQHPKWAGILAACEKAKEKEVAAKARREARADARRAEWIALTETIKGNGYTLRKYGAKSALWREGEYFGLFSDAQIKRFVRERHPGAA